MMSLTPLDHGMAVVLLLIALEGKWQIGHLITMLKHGVSYARVQIYYETIYMQWVLAIWLLLTWLTLDRAWNTLGFSLGNWLSWIVGPAVLGVVVLLLYAQRRSIMGVPLEKLDKVRQRLGDALAILPRTAREYRWFAAVSVTAGFCEELLYRGFMIWYLNHWCPPWLSLILSCTAFGLAHYYQGVSGILKTGIVGLLMGILYLLTETLLWPILAHALVDLGAAWASGALLRGEAPDKGRLEVAGCEAAR
jgi:uncharacterized protein